jgi:hypothetical protein
MAVRSGGLSFEESWHAEGLVFHHEENHFQLRLTAGHYYSSNNFQELEQAFGLPTPPTSLENYSIVNQTYLKPTSFLALDIGGELNRQSFPFTTNTFQTAATNGFVGNLDGLVAGSSLPLTVAPRYQAGVYFQTEWALGSWIFNGGFRVNYNTTGKTFDFDPRGGITFLGEKEKWQIYLKAGKFSQLPLLIQTADGYGTPMLRSPYNLEFNLGSTAKIGIFDFKVETYLNQLKDQIVTNPAGTSSLTNGSEGRSYGIDFTFKKLPTPRDGFLAVFSYAYNKSDRTYYAGPNLGYVWGNFRREVNHSFNLILGQVLVPNHLTLSLRSTYSTGRPYTRSYVTNLPGSSALTTVEDSVKFTEKTPPRMTFDLRLEYKFKMFRTGEGSVYLDLWGIEGIFGWNNVVIYNPDAGAIIPGNKNYDAKLKSGDLLPNTAVNDLPSFHLIGFRVIF